MLIASALLKVAEVDLAAAHVLMIIYNGSRRYLGQWEGVGIVKHGTQHIHIHSWRTAHCLICMLAPFVVCLFHKYLLCVLRPNMMPFKTLWRPLNRNSHKWGLFLQRSNVHSRVHRRDGKQTRRLWTMQSWTWWLRRRTLLKTDYLKSQTWGTHQSK